METEMQILQDLLPTLKGCDSVKHVQYKIMVLQKYKTKKK